MIQSTISHLVSHPHLNLDVETIDGKSWTYEHITHPTQYEQMCLNVNEGVIEPIQHSVCRC